MSQRIHIGGVLRELWDDDARTYTSWGKDGKQTEQRPYTAAEAAAADAAAAEDTADRNRTTVADQAAAALDANAAYLGTASPTNAQVAAQVKALTRQANKLIRLQLGKLDGTD